MPVIPRIAELEPEITAWRQDFHRHPELLFDLPRTAARVAALCRSFGCDEVTEGVGRSGVVAVIKGGGLGQERLGQGGAIGLRADMDALPITEQSGLPFASQMPGRMHACGHDGHTAMLLGAAKYLCETRGFHGSVVCIFQPAEEGGGGGREMVRDGLFDRWQIDEVYALHNLPGLSVGSFAIRPGPIMAAADQFEIVVTGRGGHAAKPQDCVDTTVVAAQIIMALQTIVSRNVDPIAQAVVSVCTLASDSVAHNVLAEVVTMKGTLRSMTPEVQDLLQERLIRIAEGTALALGATARVTYRRGYPVTVNAAANTNHAAEVAAEVAGPAAVDRNAAPMMGAEDFSFLLNERPGAYIFLGNGDTAMLHHSAYRFDDRASVFGASWFARMAERRLTAG